MQINYKGSLNTSFSFTILKYMDIQQLIDIDYVTDIRKSRRKGSGGTQEFYTPYSIVEKMCNKIPQKDWADPSKTFLEPAFGNGNFCLMIVYKRLQADIDWKTALNTLYGVELCDDNVIEAKERILDLLDKLNIQYDKEEALRIMNHNLVCHNFFTWNFEEWRPMTEEEIKINKKR